MSKEEEEEEEKEEVATLRTRCDPFPIGIWCHGYQQQEVGSSLPHSHTHTLTHLHTQTQ